MKKTKKILAFALAFLACVSVLAFTAANTKAAPKAAQISKIYCINDGLKIVWNKVDNVNAYKVYRICDGELEWTLLKTTKKTYYIDRSTVSGKEYHYMTVIGDDSLSNVKSYTYLSRPTAQALADNSGISVTWSSVSGAVKYNVYRKKDGESYKKIASVTSLNYTDCSVKENTTYCYAVRAVSKNGCKSKYSQGVKQTAINILKAPSGLSVKNSPKGVKLTWKNNSSAPEKYEIYRKAGKSSWVCAATVKSTKSSFIDKTAPYGKKCYYKIRSVAGGYSSDFSKSKALYALDPKKPAVALTFDDGPYTPVTNKILDTLEKNNSRATFFVVGSRISTYKDCIKREAALDCEIGCHTYNHAILTRLNKKEIKREISSAVKAIEKQSGKKVRIVRTPGGAVNDTVKAAVKYPMINWSVDTLDWQHRTKSKTVSAIKANVKDGSIILMHDLYTSTGEASTQIIPWLVKEGYQLVTVSELFELKGIELEKGVLYWHA